jgi:hypothetical protein
MTRTDVPEPSGPWLESACSPHAPSASKLRTHSPHSPPSRGCPRYKAGPPWRVTDRKPGTVWSADDVEREERDAG